MSDFDISRVDRIETRRKPGAWKGLLCAAVAMATVSAASTAYANNDANVNPITTKEAIHHKEIMIKGFDTINTPMMNRIKDATVFITLTNKKWMPIAFGSGAILSEHRANGEKTVLTVLHVSGTESLDKGLHLIISDRHGNILGVANPLLKQVPKGDQMVTSDQPVLLAFDPRYPINRSRLSKIQGVELAKDLPRGSILGRINSGVGVYEGASGGPWFNKDGKVIGVTDLMLLTPKQAAFSQVLVYGDNMISRIFSSKTATQNGYEVMSNVDEFLPSVDQIMVQGVGAPSLITALKQTSVKPNYSPEIITNAEFKNAFGLGYPLTAPMAYSANLTLNPLISINQTVERLGDRKKIKDGFEKEVNDFNNIAENKNRGRLAGKLKEVVETANYMGVVLKDKLFAIDKNNPQTYSSENHTTDNEFVGPQNGGN